MDSSLKRIINKFFYMIKRNFNRCIFDLSHKLMCLYKYKDPYKYELFDVLKMPFPAKWSKYNHDNIIVEIGTGHGDLMKSLGGKDLEVSIIGFEITHKYSRRTEKKISKLSNCKVFHGEGYFLTKKLFSKESINKIFILFPDPWHKKKHHKRRGLNSKWLKEIYEKLNTDGEIFFATDWNEFYDFVLKELSKINKEKPIYEVVKGKYDPAKLGLPSTHYYEKWKEIGRDFQYLIAKKI